MDVGLNLDNLPPFNLGPDHESVHRPLDVIRRMLFRLQKLRSKQWLEFKVESAFSRQRQKRMHFDEGRRKRKHNINADVSSYLGSVRIRRGRVCVHLE